MARSNSMPAPPPPRDVAELAARASALTGSTLAALARAYGRDEQVRGAQRKGSAGQLLELALGASSGSRPWPDFAELGVELKTLPLDASGRPKESTFLCSFALADAEHADWTSSHLRRKLAHVLFVPVVDVESDARIGAPFFWRPSAEQEAILRADFDDLVGMIALGQIEAVSAHLGRWLQLRPKAAHGRVRTRALGPDGEHVATIPRGFYLRARVTRALLDDPATCRIAGDP